jgi:hypothetical protein
MMAKQPINRSRAAVKLYDTQPHYEQDSGTRFSEETRDEIEHGDEGRGHEGNKVDFAQRTADSEDDPYIEQAERIVRSLEKDPMFGIPTDPEKRREYVEQLAEELRGENGQRKPTQPQDGQEEPMLTRKAHDRFFGNIEEMKKYAARKL